MTSVALVRGARRVFRFFVPVVLLLALDAPPARAADAQRWVKVAAPEFTVITSLREKEALAWSGEFAQFVAALQSFMRVNPKRLPRLTLVVFARDREFERFKPLRADGTPMDVGGFFSRRESWSVAGLVGSDQSEDTRGVIFHEGTHWFLSALELPNPVWLEEGLAEVYSTFAIEGKKAVFGRAIESHVLALRTMEMLPLEQLLFLPQENLHAGGEDAATRAGLAYAQSWAFVHYLIFGQREVPKRSLVEYVEGLRTKHPDEAFQQAFGSTYAQVERKLKEYLVVGRYYVAKQPLAELPALAAHPATEFEVRDALARLRIAGHRYADARQDVAAAITASPDDPRVYELQGELESEAGDAKAARGAFQKAIEKGSKDFRPYYELAAATHAGAGEADGSVSNLTPESARAIANLYEKSINANPRFRPAYQGLAGVVELVPAGNDQDVRFLELGRKLFPDDGMVRLGLATIAKRAGDTERARALVTEVLNAKGQESHVLAYAQRIERSWLERDVFSQVNALADQKKFAEAIAVIDAQMKAGADFATRQRLKSTRDQLEGALLLEDARVALSERRIDDAKAKYQAILDSNASPILKGQVRRQLEQLNARTRKTRAPD